ncbi:MULTISPECIES: non-heme iron oxygenase ferredoxin subunit [unclassified Brevibacterium]|uniref:non-heme iron oxygenase ferredoxin subunit n=1 Tax=unclassified Brevibacterium TaxID=2614124 RepID=UPI0010F9BAE0|nr:non-heme iron oxygenase ferredoxin subunit [Brevibacterium sp. 2SA]MCM1012472.1 non-heme iron oxygenase ferredoxin subunit [Brevibacterium sp. XM4083]
MTMIDVAASEDVALDSALRIDVENREICLARDSFGVVHAIDDLCTHGEVSLAEGDVEGCAIECWLHGSQFDLNTGQPLSPPAFEPVAVYPCQEIAGRILLDPNTTVN